MRRSTVAFIILASFVSGLACLVDAGHAADTSPCPGTDCAALDRFFSTKVWPKVAALECLKCHQEGGDAEETRLVLHDLSRIPQDERNEVMRRNRNSFL